jgi:hypothetical protein
MRLGNTTRRSLLPVLGGILPFLLVALSRPAAAFEDREKEAKKACISGDYAKGVDLLAELFVETNDLNYVFNQGRCFEQNGRYQDAINRFREYARKLRDKGKPADPDVERHIADCQALLENQGSALATPTDPVTSSTQPKPETGSAGPEAEIAQAPPAAARPRAGLRTAGLVTLGLGVAGLATGVLLNVKANALADELARSDTSYSRGKAATRDGYVTWSWVGYGVGAACVAGGAVLLIVGLKHGRPSHTAFVPVAGPGRAGVALQGTF